MKPQTTSPVDSNWLRNLCLEAGASDVGLVEIDRPALDDQRDEILNFYPATKTLISIVYRINREPVINPARSVANLEFQSSGDETNAITRKIVTQLERQGIRAINPPMAFPMETDPSRKNPWVVSHKPVAVAAGMGMMGLHRNVIHPKFGNFILLATVLVGAPVDHYNQPIDYNPCMSCKLCVAVCPVGAIAPDGHFDSTACYTHNYREFQANFGDWVETIADSKNGLDYRRKVTRSETVSMWQSLSFGTSYKSGYCLAVCPAGEDVIGLFNENRPAYVKEVVKPLQEKEEAVYVVPNTDAETYLKRHFPKKTVRHVRSSTTPMTIAGFIAGTKIGFQRHHSEGLNATFHFTFTGKESQTATIVIQNKTIDVQAGHQGTAQLHVTADSQTWLGFLAKERSLLWALLKRKIKISGSPKLLVAFGKCFPS